MAKTSKTLPGTRGVEQGAPLDIDIDFWKSLEPTLPERPQGSITVSEFSTLTGMSLSGARVRLNDEAETGKLVKHVVRGAFGRVTVFTEA